MSDTPRINAATPDQTSDSASAKHQVPVVTLGASAGGLDAFRAFFGHIPSDSGLAFVLIQHLSPDYPSLIPELLAGSTKMPILQVTEPVEIQADHVYVIAPNTFLSVRGNDIKPSTRQESSDYRSPIDHFLRSLAHQRGEKAIGIILSGEGSDGAIGLQSIKKYGGLTLVQDPHTCDHKSMPRAAIATGMVDQVLPIEGLASRLLDFCDYGRPQDNDSGRFQEEDILAGLPAICQKLAEGLGHDFSRYKQSTLVRRIQRRMHMLRLTPTASYIDLLNKDPAELEQLFKDLLISVTEFFRDREVFEALGSRVVPKLLQRAETNGSLRIWLPGCATGQEAYSMAILIREYMERSGAVLPVQIFATDIDGEALETARQAMYGEDTAEQVSPDRLSRYFKRHHGGYQVGKDIRDMCIFSVHNLINDPPFSRMDLVSCRNVLIYFESSLQQRVIPLFHYALKSGGYLVLGPAESLGALADAFIPVDKKLRLFQAKPSAASAAVRLPRSDGGRSNRIVVDTALKMRVARDRDAKEIHERAVLDWYAPPSVLINADGEVLHFVRRTSRFLEPPIGTPSHNLFDIVRDELRLTLRNALNQAKTSGHEVVREHLTPGEMRLTIVVRPLKESENGQDRFVVVFQEHPDSPNESNGSSDHAAPHRYEEVEAIQQLERELRSTKECLQSTIEELENSNEELKSSNEELISINEEYQSANESLQTSKEELQSLNEELETVNTELSKKVDELDHANADMRNLFASSTIATLFLDDQLRIRKFTPAATELFNLIDTDIGRPLLDITAKFDAGPMFQQIDAGNRGEPTSEVIIYKPEDHCHYVGRVNSYRAIDGTLDGVVINFIDVTDLKSAEALLREIIRENEKLHQIGLAFSVEHDLQKLVQQITDSGTAIVKAEFGACFYNQPQENSHDVTFYALSGNPPASLDGAALPPHLGVWDTSLSHTGAVRSSDLTQDPRFKNHFPYFSVPGIRSYLAVPVRSRDGEILAGLFFGHSSPDVFTEREEVLVAGIAGQAYVALNNARTVQHLRLTAHELQARDAQLRQLADSMPQIVWTARPDGHIDYFNERWYEYTGYTNDLSSNNKDEEWMPIVHPEDLAGVVARWTHSVTSGDNYEIGCRLLDRNTTEYRWHLARAKPVRDEDLQIVRWFGTSTDIHDLVEAEAALRETAQRKDEFLAMLSHELRNPLAPMRTGLQILEMPETDAAESAEIRSMLQRQMNHLSRIVDDLLDVSRISRGKVLLRTEAVDFVALTQTSINDLRLSIQSSGLRLLIDIPSEPLWINGDPTRICQMISNLLHNACKFTDRGGSIHVTLRCHDRFANLTIQDTGMGMTQDTLRRIFVAFNQADTSLDRSRGGLGLGLALVKGLAELHGGTVRAESEGVDKGSTFVVEIPLTDARPNTKINVAPSTIQARRIVLVEDNLDAARTLAHLLRRRGHEVTTANDGREGVATVLAQNAEILLCDIGLPGDLDGYAVARTLKAMPENQHLIMIALTGYGREEDQRLAAEAGFHFHFTKPIDVQTIDGVLRSLDPITALENKPL